MVADLSLAIASLAVLAVAADQFITGAARIATRLGASQLFIGAVLLGIGTSLPDGLVSAIAAERGDAGIALGNLIGSNTFNVTVVLGAGAIILPVAVRARTLRREALYAAGAVVLFLAATYIGLGTATGLVLLALVPVALWAIRGHPPEPAHGQIIDREHRLPREIPRAFLGLVFTVVSSRLLVDASEGLALDVGISEAIIGLTLVAIGTSIPELAVSIQAARRGEGDLLIGNVLGSTLFNCLLIGGVIGVISPSTIQIGSLAAAGWLMLATCLIATLFLATGRKLIRWEGVALIAAYFLGTIAVSIA